MHQGARWDRTVSGRNGSSMISLGPVTRWRSTVRSFRANPIITSSRPWGRVDGRPDQGYLIPTGWGADLGYPGFRPGSGGDAVAAQVLRAPLLATAWPDLDRFEGPEYRRILVPVFSTGLGPGQADERQLYTVANLYTPTESQRSDSEASQGL
jgi:hypothetical protein